MPRRYVLSSASIATLVLANLVGCSSDDPAPAQVAAGCLVNSECTNPLSCTFGRCHAACNETRDCQRGERCLKLGEGNTCQFADEMTCTFTSQCPSPLKC